MYGVLGVIITFKSQKLAYNGAHNRSIRYYDWGGREWVGLFRQMSTSSRC